MLKPGALRAMRRQGRARALIYSCYSAMGIVESGDNGLGVRILL